MKKYIASLFFILFSAVSILAQTDIIPEPPNPPRLVNDFSKEMPDFLSDQDEAQLERKLEDFSNQTSNQIVIIIVDDFGGMEPEQYATALGNKWGVGQSKFKNGVIILVKPTGGKGQRKSFIAPGKGLGGAIPDITAKRIVDNELNPNFANGNVYEAFDKTTDVLMALAKGEINSDEYGKKGKGNRTQTIIMLIAAILFIILFSYLGGKTGGKGGGGLSMGSGFWLGSMMGGRSSGGFGGGSSGGFGGFGGGGFGGGGAGGSW